MIKKGWLFFMVGEVRDKIVIPFMEIDGHIKSSWHCSCCFEEDFLIFGQIAKNVQIPKRKAKI
jgi:hypothetical protein